MLVLVLGAGVGDGMLGTRSSRKVNRRRPGGVKVRFSKYAKRSRSGARLTQELLDLAVTALRGHK